MINLTQSLWSYNGALIGGRVLWLCHRNYHVMNLKHKWFIFRREGGGTGLT